MQVTIMLTRQQRIDLEQLLRSCEIPAELPGQEGWVHGLCFDAKGAWEEDRLSSDDFDILLDIPLRRYFRQRERKGA